MKKYSIEGDACVVGIFADDGRKFKSVYATQNVMTEEEFDNASKKQNTCLNWHTNCNYSRIFFRYFS